MAFSLLSVYSQPFPADNLLTFIVVFDDEHEHDVGLKNVRKKIYWRKKEKRDSFKIEIRIRANSSLRQFSEADQRSVCSQLCLCAFGPFTEFVVF